ncbi:hypothetical protein G6F46_009481 [Rhizopus delemar]|uniref:Uncharacterized protein n=1 Tax=Rhizopus delemar (strain RA 99-880 / ATCC MYA-4621 / FGSC 9543 / NRRL 43880) TaxID=246409 RepID=I1BIQ6_RHIO9|nr:hypothetical protein RO3G_00790 [Rhizopus delemar RA 99-880]KAG1492967.1 hypothetical protein G6F54_008922 [Rhizopus delemar]KAG1552053.1 hypothetical protein G6F49_008796 [Rhizopus delemar]KAG1594931.1 hypothetical protein G6F47_008651 [Rhizopus delemar]KAG1611144.1 hypothetical protein G6F46_009481 [Rhizopus delemar]|eukprot:EIE76086.1 hypothetical protein RO3G_00790 [Rhizopus delemar RA 99-880]
MYQLVQLAATFDDQSSQQPDDMDLVSNNLEESTDIVPPTSQSPTTLEEPHSVVQQLQKTRPTHTDVTSFPTVTESSTNNKIQFPDAPWHNPAKVDAIKQFLLRQRELCRAQREAAAARFFQPPSPNQGFKYLYIPTKARIPVGTLHTMFRRIGVNNARLLDIHYPTRNTAAILIHNDFETKFTELLKNIALHSMRTLIPIMVQSLKILSLNHSPILSVMNSLSNTKLQDLNVPYNTPVFRSNTL